ncbi:hypothetical protein CORC01_06466 [Colletotrichum orchidophilum]|uniref:Zn(2)-C6 fungal-type domain-containing protein n=1 Tax=Colletotrichum orchidophilum TaxID=1209926 RepID=A0A1G4BA38_9PEZI|nr:uncharacterized protein CORC01_06466 [Colletotrichum orchidophilum]OHE98269.1 hypothetical protein CORC01_06466 [Colletotrichum orchidophilum]
MSSPASANATGTGGRIYKRRPGACETCKVRKRKCDGGRPSCDKCLSASSFCFYVTPKKRGRSIQNGFSATTRQSASFDDSNFLSQQTTPNPSPKDQLDYFGSSSTQSSFSGVNRLVEIGRFPAPATTGSLEEHWGLISGGRMDLPEVLGAQSTGIIASPASSALDYCWSTQLLPNGQNGSSLQHFGCLIPEDWNDPNLLELDDKSTLEGSVQATSAYSTIDMVKLLIGRDRSSCNSKQFGQNLMDLVDESATCCHSPGLTARPYDMIQPSLDTLVEFLHAFTASEPYLGVKYIEESEILRLFEEVVIKGISDHAKSSLIYATLSIGCSISLKRADPSQEKESHMRCLYSNAMVHVEKLHSCHPSALSFKALVTILITSIFWKPEDTEWLLGLAVSCAQSLRLNALASIKTICQTDQEVELLKHAFWLLYTIEKPFRLRNGQPSSLDNAFIDHEPSHVEMEAGTPSTQAFGIHYRLAQCCARVAEEFDSRDALSRSTSHAAEHLDHWLAQLQGLSVDVFIARHRPTPTTSWDSRMALPNSPDTTFLHGDISASLLYFELVLCVCGRFSANAMGCLNVDETEQQVLDSAIDVLNLLVEVDPTKAGTDQNLVRIAVSSFCLVAAFISRANDQVTTFRNMVSALGFFARLTVTSPLMTLGKFSSVVDYVQKTIKNGS